MRVGAFVNITKPEERGDCWRESLMSVFKWADEVFIVDGQDWYDEETKEEVSVDHHILWIAHAPSEYMNRTCWDYMDWPDEWSWDELPKHLNRGLELCRRDMYKLDWAIRFDIDYVYPDDFGDYLRDKLAELGDKRVATFQKFSSVLYNRFYQKGGIQLGINLKYDDIWYGVADEYTDLCIPIITKEDGDGIPHGKLVPEDQIGRTGLDFFNYDYAFKTEEFTRDEFYRFSEAQKRYFGKTRWGQTKDEAFDVFMKMMQGRLNRCVYDIPVDEQPSFIQNRLLELESDKFCYNGWNKLVDNSTGHVSRISHNKR